MIDPGDGELFVEIRKSKRAQDFLFHGCWWVIWRPLRGLGLQDRCSDIVRFGGTREALDRVSVAVKHHRDR
jgi:hypothetical protein